MGWNCNWRNISFPNIFLAANNVSLNSFSRATKQVLNVIRAFPELILAFVLLPITGLGPLTGTLAVGIHSIGTLGKLSSEVIEGIDEGPLESIKSSGGSKLNELFFGVIPQVMPTITSYWLYRFEINLRASAVLGVVGAGGVGAELINQLRFRDFPRAGTVLVVTILMVLIVDTISAAIRRRIIKGREIKFSIRTKIHHLENQNFQQKRLDYQSCSSIDDKLLVSNSSTVTKTST